MKKVLFLIGLAFLLLSVKQEKILAQSLTHTTLTYTCLGNQQYDVELHQSRDCRDTTPLPPYVVIDINGQGSCAATAFSDTLYLQSGSRVATMNPFCRFALCGTNGYYNYQIQEYTGSVDLSTIGTTCGWRLSYQNCCRTTGPSHILQSMTTDFYTEALLVDQSLAFCNSSPQSPDASIFTVCDSAPQRIDHRLLDPDGDSLGYQLVAPLSSLGGAVTYATGFSPQQPLTSLNGVQIDQAGILTFTPTGVQETSVDLLVSEYRNGVLIAQMRRPLHFVVFSCSAPNNPPVLIDASYYDDPNGNWVSLGASTVFPLCLINGSGISIFRMDILDVDGDTLRVNPLHTNLDQVFGPGNWSAFLNTSPPYSPSYVQLFLRINPTASQTFPFAPNRLFSTGIVDGACPFSNLLNLEFSIDTSACNRVEGTVFIDHNNNCQRDPTEPNYDRGRVRFEQGNRVVLAPISAAGRYMVQLDTGSYNVSVLPFSPAYRSCVPQTFVYTQRTTIETLDMAVQIADSCAQLIVDIGAPLLRHCLNNYYTVEYCNTGSDTIEGVYIDVVVDSLFVVDFVNHPIDSQSGNFYRFYVGAMPGGIAHCRTIQLYGRLDTTCNSSWSGQMYCATARIYPDTVTCGQGNWQGAELLVEGECINNVPRFRIHNVGASAMRYPTVYRTYLGQYLYTASTPIQLAAGAATPWVTYPAHVDAYRVEIEQDSHYIWSRYASNTLVGCNRWLGGGSALTNPVNLFAQNDGDPQYSIDCQPSLLAWDPNDKQAFPVGYGADHNIEPNTDLEYRIRFQNTGTYFATDVVILDTLSPHLDVSSVRPNVSSHPYTWRILDQRVLEFTFANIMLPDSGRDQLGSQGFIDYDIKQRPSLPLGTRIENRAAIYFDLNPPVLTNTTWHTIDENFVRVISVVEVEAASEGMSVTAMPNPFWKTTCLRLDSERHYSSLHVAVYNSMGQLVQQGRNQGGEQQVVLERGNLPSGVYFYRLTANGKWLHSGRLIVQ